MIASTVDVRDDTWSCILGCSELKDMGEFLFRRPLAITQRQKHFLQNVTLVFLKEGSLKCQVSFVHLWRNGSVRTAPRPYARLNKNNQEI